MEIGGWLRALGRHEEARAVEAEYIALLRECRKSASRRMKVFAGSMLAQLVGVGNNEHESGDFSSAVGYFDQACSTTLTAPRRMATGVRSFRNHRRSAVDMQYGSRWWFSW